MNKQNIIGLYDEIPIVSIKKYGFDYISPFSKTKKIKFDLFDIFVFTLKLLKSILNNYNQKFWF